MALLSSLDRITPKQKLLGLLYISYLWLPIRNEILRQNRRRQQYIIDSCSSSDARAPNCAAAGHSRPPSPTPNSDSNSNNINNNSEHQDEGIHVDLVPPMGRVGKFYYICSTCVHGFFFVQNTIVMLTTGEQNNGTNSYTCHMPRLWIYYFLGPHRMIWISWVVSGLHLIWRYLILVRGHTFDLDMVPFVLCDEHVLRAKIMQHQDRKNEKPLLGDDLQHDDDDKDDDDDTLTSLDELLFYRTTNIRTGEVTFWLRPNRTLEARAKLLNLMESCHKIGVRIFLFMTAITFPAWLFTALFQQDLVYVGCRTDLFDLAYFTRPLVSILPALATLFDSVFALLFPTTIALALTYDLTTYWLAIEKRLVRFCGQVGGSGGHVIHQPVDHDTTSIKTMDTTTMAAPTTPTTTTKSAQCGSSWPKGALIASNVLLCAYLKPNRQRMERESFELQRSLIDFFDRLRRFDKYMSTVIGFVFCVWLFIHGVVGITGLPTLNRELETIVIRSVQAIGLFFITLLSFMVLSLKRRTEPAYKTICSLMALDPSIHRRHWSGILTFYTDHRYAFTIWHEKVHTNLIYLKFISYTFTFIFFIEKIKTSLQERFPIAAR